MKELCFSLRTPIRPHAWTKEDISLAIDYAIKSGMDDICIFLAAEEANDGFYTKKEFKPWLETAHLLREATLEAGLTFSVNPWHVLLHADRGRVLKEGQNFTRMVDFRGRQASAMSCPLCPELRKWILWNYETLTKELNPNIIWVEDDLRFHNHSPLDWGGCFCELHMEEYQNLAGEEFSREEFYKAIIKPGKPHPYRQAWLKSHRDTLNDLAKIIGDTVHKINPDTKVAFMSSSPVVHNAEGRDWEGILRGLAGDKNPPIDRVHLPAYSESAPGAYQRAFNTISLYTRACMPEDTLILPEIENYPFSRFMKSDAFLSFQILSAAALKLAGMTFDLFDIGGGGIFTQEHDPKLLKAVRARVQKMNKTKVFDAPFDGVKVLSSSRAASFINTKKGERLEELYPDEIFWSAIFGAMGIPFYHLVDQIPTDGVCAVSGQYFRSIKEEEILDLFKNCKLLMTGEAAAILSDLGLGHLAGIKDYQTVEVNTGVASYEKVSDGSLVLGVNEAHCSAQMSAGDWFKIAYDNDVDTYSLVFNAKNEVQGKGVTLSADGKVAILPYGNFAGHTDAHLHPVRQYLLQKAIVALGYEFFAKDARNLSLYKYQLDEGKTGLYLVNASLDPCKWLDLNLGQEKLVKAQGLDGENFESLEINGNKIKVDIDHLSSKLIIIETE